MKINKFSLIIFISLVLLTISAVNAQDIVDNETIYLTNDENTLQLSDNSIYVDDLQGDDRNDGKSWDSSVKSLDKALNLSSDGDTIYIASGNYSSQGNTRINITKSVNVIGDDDTTFDGLGKDYIFRVIDNKTVTFKNIKFVNAYKDRQSYGNHNVDGEPIIDQPKYGAALDIGDSAVTIDNCYFLDNEIKAQSRTKANGGAISNFGDLTILNSYFYGNSISPRIGSADGGGSVYNRGKLRIDNSSFIASSGKTSTMGAAIQNEGFLEINNSVISNSTAGANSYGSAIYNNGTLILLNSIIKNNQFTANGGQIFGAIYNSGNFTGLGNLFEENSFKKSNRVTYSYSGNIYNSGILNLTYNTFKNNMEYGDSSSFSADVHNYGGDVLALNNNWWSTNENPYKLHLTNYAELSSWLILSLTPDYAALNISDELSIQAVLKPNVGSAQTNLLPNFNVTFKTIFGNSIKELINGQTNYIFNYTQEKGSYEIVAELGGFEQSIFVDVGKLESNIAFNFTENMTYQDVFQINVTVNGNGKITPTGQVLMSLGGKEYIINLSDGSGSYEIQKLNKGNYDLKLTYFGDDEYARSLENTTFRVKRLPVDLTVNIPNVKVGELVSGEVILNTSGAEGTYKLYLDGNFLTENRLYPGTTPIKRLGTFYEGIHNVTLEYEGSDNYEPENITTTFEVTKYSTILNVYAKDINAGEDAKITIEVIPEDMAGYAKIYINDNEFEIFLEQGNFTNITISNLTAGRYDVKVVYLGDDAYYGANDTASFRVVRQSSNLTVEVIREDKARTGQIVVKTDPSKCTGAVGVYVNFKFYEMNLTNGEATFDVEFDRGTNYIFVYYEGDDHYEGCEWNTTVGIAENFELIGDNVTVYEHNDFNYTILLLEETGVPMMDKIVSIEFNGKTYNVTTDKRGLANLTLNLAKGNYTIFATYDDETINNTITVNEIIFDVTATDIKYGENEEILIIFDEDVVGNASVFIKDILNENIAINKGLVEINLPGLNAGSYTVNVRYSNRYFNSTQVSKTFKVEKLDLNLTYEFDQREYDITVENFDNATGYLTLKIDDSEYNELINNSKVFLNLDDLSKGNHTFVIKYDGDVNYNPTSITSYIFVKELTTDIVVTINDGIYGDTLTATAVMDKNATGIIRFTVEGISKDIESVDGVATLNFTGIDAGAHNINVHYLGDTHYLDVENSTSFNIGKSKSTIGLYVLEAYLDENIMIYANLSPNATGKVLYSMDNYYSPRFKNTVDSKSHWYISPLETGSYTVRATFEGDNNYFESSTVFILTISQKRAILKVEIEEVSIKDRVVANIKLTNSSGDIIKEVVTLELNSRTYEFDMNDNQTSLVIGKFAAGNYSYTVNYKGNDEYGKTSYTGTFEVRDTRLGVVLSANDLTKFYKGDKKLSVKLISSKGKAISDSAVNFVINGETYSAVTDENGVASIDINLNSGNYIANINFEGDEDYLPNDTRVNVTVMSTVEGIDVYKLYGSSEQYYAIFSDSNGKPLVNTPVKFKIGSKSYTANTLPNGIVRLNINLKAGSYTITAINPVTSQKYSNKIVIYNRLMENKDVTKYYGGSKSFKVRAYGDDGKVAAGVTVKIKVNGVTYKVKTDSKGYATLGLNLKPGKYTIKATYKSYTVTNKVTVKTTLITKNLSKKKSKTTKYQAKLIDNKGKVLKNKKITFKFKGKKYVAKTNSKGIATITIKVSLKVGTYKIYSYYGKLKNTNTIKIK